jgi:hypothetical protein
MARGKRVKRVRRDAAWKRGSVEAWMRLGETAKGRV